MPASETPRKPAEQDPAYMKPEHYPTMETRDLQGRRPSKEQLRRLSQRNLNRSFEQGILAGASSVGGSLFDSRYDGRQRRSQSSTASLPRSASNSQQQKGRRHRQVAANNASDLLPPALMSTSNADVARLEATLCGEYDIISRSHAMRYEQDSAFKKDRVLTPEIAALKSRKVFGAAAAKGNAQRTSRYAAMAAKEAERVLSSSAKPGGVVLVKPTSN